jgi:hypothetical protein
MVTITCLPQSNHLALIRTTTQATLSLSRIFFILQKRALIFPLKFDIHGDTVIPMKHIRNCNIIIIIMIIHRTGPSSVEGSCSLSSCQ